jgi:hypothetical protein
MHFSNTAAKLKQYAVFKITLFRFKRIVLLAFSELPSVSLFGITQRSVVPFNLTMKNVPLSIMTLRAGYRYAECRGAPKTSLFEKKTKKILQKN